ncbi:hypothetical protein PV325_009950 [Microctonus aethiopoides]|nr:hypothetical protein PV325_009950 [Microctonus aethiopoides]KAK0078136.1 hypothetical protein PV326_009567 [Microctonus aethiopoides]
MNSITFNIFIPLEWINDNYNNYENLLYDIIEMTADYTNRHGTHNGMVLCFNNVEAILIIDIITRIWWYRRIRIEDNPRPSMVNYYTPIAPPELEDEWQWGGNNIENDEENNDIDDDDEENNNIENEENNNIENDDEVNNNIENDDDEENNNIENDEMAEFFLQNWISAMSADDDDADEIREFRIRNWITTLSEDSGFNDDDDDDNVNNQYS